MFKKTTLAFFIVLFSSLALAGTMGPVCLPGNVTVPCESSRWDLAVTALYLQPVYSSDKGYEMDAAHRVKTVEPTWDFAYQLEGSYHFYTGNDITLTYMNFENQSLRFGYGGFIPFVSSFNPFTLKIEDSFDQVNLVLGQKVDISPRKSMRFYGGLQYAKIRVDTDNNFTTVPLPLILKHVSAVVGYRNVDFNGVGPTMGVDLAFDLARGFSVTANSAMSLLYGTDRYSSGFVLAPAGAVLTSYQRSYRTVVPSLEGKVGLKYSHDFAEGTLQLEGGFQALNYFSALETRRFTGPVNYHDTSNFSLYGPYLGVKWLGFV